MEDEIDLGKYARMIAGRWRMIRDCVLLGLVVALVVGRVQPLTYEATAGVVIVKSRTQVNFDPKIKTLSAEELSAAGAAGAVDAAARRSTLAALVKNSLVAQDVIDQIGSQLPDGLQDPEVLVQMVEGSLTKDRSDLIEVRVSGKDPAYLAAIANAWAASYEKQANRIYAGRGTLQGSLDPEVASARAQYEKASDALIQFTADNRIEQYTRQIDDRRKTADLLFKGRQDAVLAIMKKETDTRTALVGQFIAAALNLGSAPLTKNAEQEVEALNSLYANRMRLSILLEDARTIRNQASRDGVSAASSDLAIQLLKAQLANPPGLSGNLQVQLGSVPAVGSTASQVSDMDALIKALETRLKDLDAAIAQQSADLASGDGLSALTATVTVSPSLVLMTAAQAQTKQLLQLQGLDDSMLTSDPSSPFYQAIDRLLKEAMLLDGQLAKEKATLAELTRARDLAWQTYNLVAQKGEEANVAAQVPGSEVTFALPAVAPLAPVARTPREVMAAAGVVAGLLGGVAAALILGLAAPNSPSPAVPWTAPLGWILRRIKGA